MSAAAYYNELDPLKAEVLREAIKAGAIAPGDVDERSIADVEPGDLVGYAQCHFFAGGGFWSLALRWAGWPDDRPVWTGSCPCPSFSAAGKGGGFDDPRHLWPHWDRIIDKSRPAVLFGEQADDAIGFGWLDLVQTDLEAKAYAVGSMVFGAHSVGAPHIRQRLYFVADSEIVGSGAGLCDSESARERRPESADNSGARSLGEPEDPRLQERELHAGSLREADGAHARQGSECGSHAGELADTNRNGRNQAGQRESAAGNDGLVGNGAPGSVADADGRHAGAEGLQRSGQHGLEPANGRVGTGGWTSPLNGFWRDADWIGCRDGKFRPVEPGTFPLAHGSAARVGRLRLYGDGIVVTQAQAFIESYCEAKDLLLMAVS